MVVAETLLLSVLIFAYCALIFLPPGFAISGVLKLQKYPASLELSISIGLGILAISGVYLLSYLLFQAMDIDLKYAAYPVLLLPIFSTPIALSRSTQFYWKEVSSPVIAIFLCYLLLVAISSFPTGNWRGISTETTMALTSLPIDAQIPFNFSRYLLEGIPPNSLEIVPGWSAFDRGPLSAVTFSAIAASLELQDSSPWLGQSPHIYFPFQAILTLLNLLSILAVWTIAELHFGRKTAALSLLILIPSQFFITSALLTWPKLLAAFFVLVSSVLGLTHRNWILAGIFGGAAVMSHDYALFASLTLLLFSLSASSSQDKASKGSNKPHLITRLPPAVVYITSLSISIAPWYLIRALYAHGPSQMLSLQLFCSNEISTSPLLTQFGKYWSTHSLSEIFAIRLSNIIYPGNPVPLFEIASAQSYQIIAILQNLHGLTFFRAFFASGPILSLILLIALPRSMIKSRSFGILSMVTLCALLPYATVLGCRDFTVSHVWAYPFTCLATIAIANTIANKQQFGHTLLTIIASIGIALNIFQTYLYLWFVSSARPFIHGTFAFSLLTGGLSISLLLFLTLSIPNKLSDEI